MTSSDERERNGVVPARPTPVRVKKLGHIVLRVSDIERSTRFWTDVLGFKVSDRNERGMVFLRHGSDHHTVALAPAEAGAQPPKAQVGFDHVALEVESARDLIAVRDFLRASGVPIVFEGRRGPGSNPGVEFLDPDGFMVELYAAMDQIGDDGQSRPSEQWRRAASLEEALANPPSGVRY